MDERLDPAIVEQLKELASDDPLLIDELMEAFSGDRPIQIAAMQTALRTQDLQALRKAAHTLKGASANMGLRRMSQRCLAIECAAREGDLTLARSNVHILLSEAQEHEHILGQALRTF